MRLVRCAECERETFVQEETTTCPFCGFPLPPRRSFSGEAGYLFEREEKRKTWRKTRWFIRLSVLLWILIIWLILYFNGAFSR